MVRIRVLREGVSEPDPDAPVGGCPVRLRVKEGRWIAEIQDPEACSPTVADMKKLGPEARNNLARHLETDDQRQRDQIKEMRKRSLS
jgi:hypothetical protein